MNDSEKIMAFLNAHKEHEQTRQVLHHLFFRGPITQLIAVEEYGVTRLASIIWKLRYRHGFYIVADIRSGRNRWGRPANYAVYRLA